MFFKLINNFRKMERVVFTITGDYINEANFDF